MIDVKSSELWSELKKLAKQKGSIKAAVAYVSDDSCVAFKEGDVLVTDASDGTIATGGTSAKVLSMRSISGWSIGEVYN